MNENLSHPCKFLATFYIWVNTLDWFEFTMTRLGCVDASMVPFYYRIDKMGECLGASILRRITMTDLSDLLELDW